MTKAPTRKAEKAAKDAADAPTTTKVDPCVLVVMGVSGSGKTTVAALLAGRLGWTFEDGDWFHPPENVAKMSAGQALEDKDRWPWLHAIADWIDATCRDGRHGVVACSALKREYRAVLVGANGDKARIVYLEGDKALIKDRMAMRQGHFMPAALLESQFKVLETPAEEENPITVSVAPHPREIVENIMKAIEADLGHPAPAGP